MLAQHQQQHLQTLEFARHPNLAQHRKAQQTQRLDNLAPHLNLKRQDHLAPHLDLERLDNLAPHLALAQHHWSVWAAWRVGPS